MRGIRSAAVALILSAFAVSACGDKKEPMVPDNPSADPMMMDAGGPAPGDTAAPAPSTAPAK